MLTTRNESTNAGHRGGLLRNSDEVSVMEMERRGQPVQSRESGQPRFGRSRRIETKPFKISKKLVYEAYKRVKANRGGCRVDAQIRQQLWRYQIKQSMSRRGNCWDNAPTERFFRSYKVEWMPKEFYSTYEEAETDVLKYIIQHYNSVRGHSYNNYLSPNAAEKIA